jgi:hypothetical protein
MVIQSHSSKYSTIFTIESASTLSLTLHGYNERLLWQMPSRSSQPSRLFAIESAFDTIPYTPRVIERAPLWQYRHASRCNLGCETIESGLSLMVRYTPSSSRAFHGNTITLLQQYSKVAL